MPVFHTIASKDIWLGDHIYIWSSPFHQHHGIVVSVNADDPDESQILEFNTYDGSHILSHARVQVVSLRQFRRNHVLKCVVYGSTYARFKRAGTAYVQQSLSPEEVVDNAQLIIEQIEFGDFLLVPNDPSTVWIADEGHGYDLIIRNCECLAYWCKTGKWISAQVEQLVENIGKYLLAFMKGIFDSLVRANILPAIGQELIRLEIRTTSYYSIIYKNSVLVNYLSRSYHRVQKNSAPSFPMVLAMDLHLLWLKCLNVPFVSINCTIIK